MNLQGCPPWKDDGDSEQARDEIEAKVERFHDAPQLLGVVAAILEGML